MRCLASWPRAREAAQASREFYRVRAEVEDALRRWQEHGRPKDRLIQPGVPLAEAENLVRRFGTELTSQLIDYVTASRNRARRRQRFEQAAALFFFGLATAAILASMFAYWERGRAQQALETITQTGTTLQYDLMTEFRARGLPSDLLGRMLGRVIKLRAGDRNPKNAIVTLAAARLCNQGRPDRAMTKGLQLDPKNARLRNALRQQGRQRRCHQDYNKAIQLDPKNAIAYVSRGNALHE